MGKLLYFVTVIGVFLQAINGQDWDIEKMEQCPCANDVVEDFLDSVAKNTVDVDNGQKLRLRLYQLKNDDCTVHVQDESPKPGRIEISMVYSGTVQIEEQGEGEDQYNNEQDEEQQGRIDDREEMIEDIAILYRSVAPVYQQGRVDGGQLQGGGNIRQKQEYGNIRQQQEYGNIGQQQGDVDIGQQEEDGDIGQQEEDGDIRQQQGVGNIGQQQGGGNIGQQQGGGNIGQQQGGGNIGQQQGGGNIVRQQVVDIGQQQVAEDIEQLLGTLDLEQLQQSMGLGQEQDGEETTQEQSQLSNGGDKKGYSAEFSFTVDVNTGKLSETGTNRRKRDIMPFETVVIKIALNLDQKPDSDVAARNGQIKSLLKKGLEDYWLAMAFCLLDVKQ